MRIKAVHLLRIGLGVDMLMHGSVRMPNLGTFVDHTSAGFTKTCLPMVLVRGFLYALSFFEASIGILILIGGRAGRIGYIAGGLLMTVLLIGTIAKQDWNVSTQQVVYLIAFAIALQFHDKQTLTLS